MKRCSKCKEEKELTEFFKDKQKKDGLKYICKICGKKQATDWSRNNSENRRLNVLKSATGVTKEQYGKLLEIQDSKCAICNKTIKENNKNLSVDHCHNSLVIRGLLCNTCNLGLGYFLDNEELLISAIKYLKNPINKDKNMKYKFKRDV